MLEDHGPQAGLLRHLEQLVAALAALQPVQGREAGWAAVVLLHDDGQAEVDRDDQLAERRGCSEMKSSRAVITPLRGPPSSSAFQWWS